MTAPMIPGKRYEISSPHANADELNSLGGLIHFLNEVGDNARLRAKDEGGIRFLHTRTGTPLGRFWKWLTVAWPEAKAQRVLFKNSVKELLENIEKKHANDVAIGSLKDRILNETLEVRNFSEFDLTRLKGELHELHKALEKKRTDSPVSPASSPEKEKGKPPAMILIAKQKPSGSEDESLSEQASGQVETDSVPASLSSVGKIEHVAMAVDTRASGTHVLKTMRKEAPPSDSESDEPSLAAQKRAVLPDDAASEATWPESQKIAYQALPPQPQPRRLKPGPSAELGAASGPEEKALPSTTRAASAPVTAGESNMPDFGCKKLTELLSASTRKPGVYEADAYILPSGTEALKFPFGKISFDPDSVQRTDDGTTLASARHALLRDDVSRNFMELRLPALRPAEDSHLATLYSSALSQAFDKGARTFVIQPLGVGLIIELEMRSFAISLREFCTSHPEAKVQAVFTSPRQTQIFKELSSQLSSSSAN
ncbi:MAG: hypothetical protein NBV65_11270 [Burkholderiaceae bacterium]|nr:hypothetical protein [Burkholderiaceae bacterium]